MSVRTRFNLVTFTPTLASGNDGPRVALTLESPWKVTAGLKPDVNHAKVSYKEFDKLNGLLDLPGKVEFWYRGAPAVGAKAAVTLQGWRVCEAQAGRIGIPVNPANASATKAAPPAPPASPVAARRVLEYTLYFTDAREAFVFPRGGRLTRGILNAGLTSADNQWQEVDTFNLIAICLGAMGIGQTQVPDVSDVMAPGNIDWSGAHAPTELAKLLEMCGLVFCLNADGTFRIAKILTAGTPTIQAADEIFPPVLIPIIDRKGKFVLITTREPTLETMTLEGPRDDQFYFVAQDTDGTWKRYDDLDFLNNADEFDEGGMLANYQDDFSRVPQNLREQLRGQAYRVLQLGDGTGQLPQGVNEQDRRLRSPAPMLLKQWKSTGQTGSFTVRARRAFAGDGGLWDNPVGPINCSVHWASDKNLLVMDEPLIQVKQKTLWPIANAKELKRGDIQVTFTSHQFRQVKGKWVPNRYLAAFQAISGRAVRLSDAEAQNLVDNPTRDTITIVRPDYTLRIVDDNPINKPDMDSMALELADKTLAKSSQALQIYEAVGFAVAMPDGLISTVEWDQRQVRTIVTVNNWHRPLGSLPEGVRLNFDAENPHAGAGGGGGGGSSGMGIGGSVAASQWRASIGAEGARQPAAPINPLPSYQVLPPGSLVCLLNNALSADGTTATGGGFYSGTVHAGFLQVDGSGTLTLPGNLKPGDKVLLANVDEAGLKTNRMKFGSWVIGTYGGLSDEQPARPMVYFHGGVGDYPGTGLGATGGVILTAANGSNADNGVWARDTDTGGKGCLLDLQTREFWDTGSNTLLAFTRQFTIDSRGMIVRVGPEERVVVLTGVAGCTG